ncbi:divalent-cation tolerance protein CutA [Chlamydia abortus]|uniref:Divalent cation tolerance protein n=1 Tax=Chlamydia abortus (strain DSM 27085 / S26/3) TaxID=218497 RepID=Q5L527_CHLAB|nr:divalent-cation tolerance protein CutA [Chlamydia abortus]ASD30932.1 divalent-cation tolerance protein CutA [Chlamydia abortus]AUS60308.1 divalent-cation tolerance protein CutA [Chlamydia abortus]EGK69560.1 putative divalent cation tolerance protein [Chlamydia abortus LLG]QEM74158.1 divalent-cation tolerance protein CutA [Chlamydia abortus]QRR31578.1 divalent-cation tolerance protein CutA [Chlamydia abortus]
MTPILILTQLPSEEEAELIAHTLITQKLAACVHVFPKGKSTYLWEGQLYISEEYHMQIKTLSSRFSEVSKTIRSLCSYDVPEIIFIKIDGGNPEYLQWLSLETAPQTSQEMNKS